MFQKTPVSKIFMHRKGRGMATRFCRHFFVSKPTNSVGENFSDSKKLVSKNSMHRRGRASRFSVEYFLSNSAKTFCGEPFSLSENFRYRNILCLRKGYHCSSLKLFCHTGSKIFLREPFCVSDKTLISKIFINRRGGNMVLSVFFLSQYLTILMGNISVFQKNSGIIIFHAQEGEGITIFCRIFFV